MQHDKKILITAPIGGTFKSLLMSPDFLPTLSESFAEIHIATTLSEKEVKKTFDFADFPKVHLHTISNFKFTPLQFLVYHTTILSYNRYIESSTFKIKLKDNSLAKLQKVIYSFLSIIAPIVSWKYLYRFFEKIKYQIFFDRRVAKLFDEVQPDVFFASGASFHFDFYYIHEAAKRKIQSIGMVYSWDNLTTKGPIFSNFRNLIVWNDFQKNEVLPFYKYKSSQIQTVGIPQLDLILQKKNEFKKNHLCTDFGISNDTLIISYGTGSPRLMPDENLIVEKIAKGFADNFDFKWHLRVRIHPQDNINRYSNLKKLQNVSIETVSDETDFVLDGRCFTESGLYHYGELLTCSDLILNIASTVGLESVILNTPTINVAFDSVEKNYYSSVARYYDFSHMKFFSSLNAYKNAYNIDDLIKNAINYLKNRDLDSKLREEAASIINPGMDGKAGYRIAKILIGEK